MKALVFSAFFLICLCFSCQMNQEPVLIPPSDPGLHYLGRIDTTVPDAYRFAWTASQLSARFAGTSLSLEVGAEKALGSMREAEVWFRIQVDDLPPKIVQVKEWRETIAIVADLSPGEHRFHLFKRSEAETGVARLYGIRLDAGAELLPMPPSEAPWIEAYGNSITCGYGNECEDREEPFSPATEDGHHTYAAIAARQLGADFSAVAWSGRGVYQNYDQSKNGTIPALAKAILPGEAGSIGIRERQPEVLLINLGTNDFAHGVPDKLGFQHAYRSFLEHLRSFNPSSKIVLLTGSMMDGQRLDTLKGWLDELQAEFQEKGEEGLYRFDLSPQGEMGYGC